MLTTGGLWNRRLTESELAFLADNPGISYEEIETWKLMECYQDRCGYDFWHVQVSINNRPYWAFGADKYEALWNAVEVLNTYSVVESCDLS